MQRLGLMIGILAAAGIAATAHSAPANPFDGEWTETIIGESPSCSSHIDTNFTVKNGRLLQKNSGGRISANGSAQGSATGGGFTATWTGRFSGNKASGRFRRNDGCVGSWEAVRQ